MSMIEVKNLTKFYGDFKAVDDISFSVNRGEVLGLLGPNGAGKSTTLRTLCGFLSATDGDILIDGHSVSEDPESVKSIIGYLPESAPIYADMMVYDYLDFIAEVRNIPLERRKSRIKELSEKCGLSAVMHKDVNELSKGYKQRVGLAHAMMSDPQILVLDEPTAGLDPNQIVEIRELIKEIGKEKTVILSSHILSEIEATCGRVVIINRGKVIADDTTGNLKRAHEGNTTLHIELEHVSYNDFKDKISHIQGIQEILDISNPEFSSFDIHTHIGVDIRKEIYQVIKQHNWNLLCFSRQAKNLEDIFRELTR